MRSGDIVFEGGSTGKFSKLIMGFQQTCCTGDSQVSHAAIAIAPLLLMEADTTTNISFRVYLPADTGYLRYIYRRKQDLLTEDMRALIGAAELFVGETYSYWQIMKSRFSTQADIEATLGGAFCSGLVKRALKIAGLAVGLSDNLLLSPSELQHELAQSANWECLDIEAYARFIPQISSTQSHVAAMMANSLITGGQIKASLLYLANVLSQLSMIPSSDYPFDGSSVVPLLAAVSSIDIARQQNHWTVQRARSELMAARSDLLNEIHKGAKDLEQAALQSHGTGLHILDSVEKRLKQLIPVGPQNYNQYESVIVDLHSCLDRLPLESACSAYEQGLSFMQTLPTQDNLGALDAQLAIRLSEVQTIAKAKDIIGRLKGSLPPPTSASAGGGAPKAG
jgi:hypothetical protein